MTGSATAACLQCGRDLDDVAASQPCPSCGGTSRNVFATAVSAVATFSASIQSVTIEHSQNRSWWEAWEHIERCLVKLRDAYQPGSTINNLDLEHLADEFFLTCWSVKDWLHNDATITPRITKPELNAYVNANSPLTVCQAYANTTKHLLRNAPHQLHARTMRYHGTPAGPRLDVESWSTTQPRESLDALDLAEQCATAWAQFLQQRGLAAPRRSP